LEAKPRIIRDGVNIYFIKVYSRLGHSTKFDNFSRTECMHGEIKGWLGKIAELFPTVLFDFVFLD
jgi:hypothetical protein